MTRTNIILTLIAIVAVVAAIYFGNRLNKNHNQNTKLTAELAEKQLYFEACQRDSLQYIETKELNKQLLAQLDSTISIKVIDSLVLLSDSLDKKIIQLNKELALAKSQPPATAGLPKKVGKVGSKGR